MWIGRIVENKIERERSLKRERGGTEGTVIRGVYTIILQTAAFNVSLTGHMD